jgi:hypothetical protein
VELLGLLIKECNHHKASKKHLAENLKAICSIIIKSI